uniref:Large ribosomal subunit protein bL17m n=1 Tax=Esox lucius TaxID=8010 RepID=A0AAY5KGR5_ESOLU
MRLTLQMLISHGRVARKMGLGPESRLNMLRNILTGLVKHERIETTLGRADEVRFYAEKLIDYAKKGDTDTKAMKMANFWLTVLLYHRFFLLVSLSYSDPVPSTLFCFCLPDFYEYSWFFGSSSYFLFSLWFQEKDLIPKLFKVLAPRFEAQPKGYTRMARIPNRENLDKAAMAVLEYKGNPFPPLQPAKRENELTLINQLLKGYREEQAQQAAAMVESQ